jgi:cysteine desulfurase
VTDAGPIYLDHAAGTPVDPAVAAAMAACLAQPALAANPSAVGHAAGRQAAALVESARADVAALLGAEPDEIVFTSGATESNNLALAGAARFRQARGRHLVSSLAEHRAVIEPLRALEREGFHVTWLAPGPDGAVTRAAVAAALRPDTTLVSLMHVNNETGAVTDVAAIGALCRERDVLFHVDAAQSAARLPIDVRAQGIDLLSLSAHKLYGPKGVGALFIDRERPGRVEPLFHGGGQERGLRPGTLATHQLLGFGLACRLAAGRRAADRARERALRDRLAGALRGLPGVVLNAEAGEPAGHILSVTVLGVDGESLFAALPGLAVASGAACASPGGEPSYVLRLLGRTPAEAEATVRFSLGRTTTAADVDAAAAQFAAAAAALRAESPATGEPDPGPAGAGRTLRGEAGPVATGPRVVVAATAAAGRLGGVAFRLSACPDVRRTCRALAPRLAGQPVTALGAIDVLALGRDLGVPVEKAGRLLIVQDALRNCLADWENGELPRAGQGA